MRVELPAFGRVTFAIACLLLLPKRRREGARDKRPTPAATAAPPSDAVVALRKGVWETTAYVSRELSTALGLEDGLRQWSVRIARLAIAAAIVPGAAYLLMNSVRGAKLRRKWVLVVCALREEAEKLECKLENLTEKELPLSTTHLCRMKRTSGILHGLRVDVLTCGVGEVDAAIATATLLVGERRNKPEAVLSVGCAGAHLTDLHAGDIGASSTSSSAIG